MIIDLTELKTGEKGIVKRLHEGHNFKRRVSSLGIREGKEITKVSAHFWRGPQTVKVGNITVAFGYGMAKKIFVEVNR